jgi:hypothetical protein
MPAGYMFLTNFESGRCPSAILASWASDAAAVASNPALRELPGSHRLVTIDDVLEALTALDHRPKGPPGGKPARIKSAPRVGAAA